MRAFEVMLAVASAMLGLAALGAACLGPAGLRIAGLALLAAGGALAAVLRWSRECRGALPAAGRARSD